mmetsp:Transcript_27210/g.75832  ORF Transcript_27210/g.75832 Transcript_27210/m.75832 type:complete len:98 (+) Transcript_27210:969-1262(+)
MILPLTRAARTDADELEARLLGSTRKGSAATRLTDQSGTRSAGQKFRAPLAGFPGSCPGSVVRLRCLRGESDAVLCAFLAEMPHKAAVKDAGLLWNA